MFSNQLSTPKSLFDRRTCMKENRVDGSSEDCTRCLDQKARTLKTLLSRLLLFRTLEEFFDSCFRIKVFSLY